MPAAEGQNTHRAQSAATPGADSALTVSKSPLIELRGATVTFDATKALCDVSFDVRSGEVHVLAGENGAGKSTLIRVLSGVITEHRADATFEGELFLFGERRSFRDARDASRHGIATIHQELSLVGSLTVAENLSLGRPGALFGWTRARTDIAFARKVLSDMELDVDPSALVETLPLAARQLIEIGRALAQNARVLIFDEPTSALSEPEAARLLDRIEKLAADGAGIVYISHRMEENERLADRITVLCDGRVVASRPAELLPKEELVALMMGRKGPAPQPVSGPPSEPSKRREPAAEAPRSDTTDGAPLFEVRDLRLSLPGVAPLSGVSFSAGRGEIVGLAGLRGAGASEALAALYGVFGPAGVALGGNVTLSGEPYSIESPARSIAQGVLYLANDRKKSVLLEMTIAQNITLSSMERLAPRGAIALSREERIAEEMTEKLRVSPPRLGARARALSGGNQQKVALLRCLCAAPRVLLLDEPTRGVDIGAKHEIHRALLEAAKGGMAIVLVTSELPEISVLCDRAIVLARGRVTSVVEKKDFSNEQLRLLLDET